MIGSWNQLGYWNGGCLNFKKIVYWVKYRQGAGEMGLNPIDLKQELKQVQERLAADSWVMGESLGYSQVGKAWDFDSHIRWFKSSYPNEKKTNIYKKWFEKWLTNQKENSKLLFVNEIGSWNQFEAW